MHHRLPKQVAVWRVSRNDTASNADDRVNLKNASSGGKEAHRMYPLHTQTLESYLDETCFIFTRFRQLGSNVSSRLPSSASESRGRGKHQSTT